MSTSNLNQRILIPNKTYFRIGDVATLLGVKPYVLRYWESEFPMINPQKSASGQRVYRKSDVEMVVVIKHLLHEERYSIEGAKKRLKELRKDGELKVFKEETLAQIAANSETELSQDETSETPQNEVEEVSIEPPSEMTELVVEFEERKKDDSEEADPDFAGASVAQAPEWLSTGTTPAPESARSARIEEIKTCALELSALLQVSITDLFQY